MSARPKHIEFFGHRMAYADPGSGSPIVFFLHETRCLNEHWFVSLADAGEDLKPDATEIGHLPSGLPLFDDRTG